VHPITSIYFLKQWILQIKKNDDTSFFANVIGLLCGMARSTLAVALGISMAQDQTYFGKFAADFCITQRRGR